MVDADRATADRTQHLRPRGEERLLGLLCWQWRDGRRIVWDIDQYDVRAAVWTVAAAAGWFTVLATTFMINHLELFPVCARFRALAGWRIAETGFRTPLLFPVVRHPMMLGFLLAFWAAPTMTAGHLLFASVTTVYILAAIRLEERDLSTLLGEPYRQIPPLSCRWWFRTAGVAASEGRLFSQVDPSSDSV